MFFIHLLFCSINPQPLPVEHVLFDFGDVVIQKDHNRVVDFFETTLGLDHTESMILYEERSRQLSAGLSDADFFADFEIRHKTKLPKNFFQSFEQVLESSIIKDEKVLRIIEKMKMIYLCNT